MSNLPTDLEILNAIYTIYFEEYAQFNRDRPSRRNKIFVPINIKMIAEKLRTEHDIVFGRLYYHLEHKFGYVDQTNFSRDQTDSSRVRFFVLSLGSDENPPTEKHCINFPYLASVLADLREEHSTKSKSIRISIAAIVISTLSALFSLLRLFFA